MGGLAATMPVWATMFGFFILASAGLPGLSGFVVSSWSSSARSSWRRHWPSRPCR